MYMAGNVEYKNKWITEKYDRVNLTIPKGKKEALQAHAADKGESLNGFVNRAIDNQIERDLKGDSHILSPVDKDILSPIEQDILSPICTPTEPVSSVPIDGGKCPHCGKEIIKQNNGLKIYCSVSCRANAFKKRKRAEERNKGGE